MNKRDIARVAHATLNAYKFINRPGLLILNWDDTTKEERDSFVAGVEWVINNPATTAEHQHTAWVKYKRDSGWLLGDTKDEVLRTHPLLIPWSDIDLEHRTKNSLFIAVVHSLLPMQNFLKWKA